LKGDDLLMADCQGRAKAALHPLIAVVDDDALFLRSVGRLIRSVGYEAALFTSAYEFLASLPALSPQCAILDVNMPGMTGLELQDRLCDRGSSLPILFVTAYDTPQTREHARRAGSLGLLLKPFGQEALLRALRQAIEAQANPETTSGQG